MLSAYGKKCLKKGFPNQAKLIFLMVIKDYDKDDAIARKLSGWIKSPETIENQAAWVRARHGKGEVHLFGFRPQYRGWSQDAFELMYRAILLEP